MDRATSKALRKYAEQAGQSARDTKRGWLKMSHKERGKVRTKLLPGASGKPRSR